MFIFQLPPIFKEHGKAEEIREMIFLSINEESEILICDVLRSVYI